MNGNRSKPPCQGFIGIGIQKPKRREGGREETIPLPYWNQEEYKEENTPLFDQRRGFRNGECKEKTFPSFDRAGGIFFTKRYKDSKPNASHAFYILRSQKKWRA